MLSKMPPSVQKDSASGYYNRAIPTISARRDPTCVGETIEFRLPPCNNLITSQTAAAAPPPQTSAPSRPCSPPNSAPPPCARQRTRSAKNVGLSSRARDFTPKTRSRPTASASAAPTAKTSRPSSSSSQLPWICRSPGQLPTPMQQTEWMTNVPQIRPCTHYNSMETHIHSWC
ncbi:hypothetical protein GY45DRAFT_695494 [Cubamyces sp. BRFM 1775]|nr:hypothetical protein GY45DRAFT_695494 [Cubamyces sp. BRFM 1775]